MLFKILFFSDDYIHQLCLYETLDVGNGHIHLCKTHRTCGYNRDWNRARNYRCVRLANTCMLVACTSNTVLRTTVFYRSTLYYLQ